MTWPKWVILGWYLFSAVAIIKGIGAPRKPITPNGAVAAIVVLGLCTVLVVLA